MISIQSLWTLAAQVGLEPSTLLPKIGEKAALHLGGKAASAIGKRASGAGKAVLTHWTKALDESFPQYVEEQIAGLGDTERSAIIEAAFAQWVIAHTKEATELSRLLFRIIYLRALVDHCTELPVVAESHLNLDDVWVPQTFRAHRPTPAAQQQANPSRFNSLHDAIKSRHTPVVLVGDSGTGKSTQLRKLAVDLARRQLNTTDFEQLLAEPLPIYVRAETLAQESADLTTAIANSISSELNLRLPLPLPERFLDGREPGTPKSLFTIIDGFDEIAPERRNELVARIKRHNDPFNIVIASRLRLDWSGLPHIEIEEPMT